MANATLAGTTPLLVSLRRSRAAVCSFAHIYAGPGCISGPAGFKAGQAFTAVYNRASRLYSRPARFKTGRPAIKPAAGFQAGQVYNRALTYIYLIPPTWHTHTNPPILDTCSFIIARETETRKPVGFTNFRFDLEEGVEVVYW